jgi:hypothetical protein
MLAEYILFLSLENANWTMFFSSNTKLKRAAINHENISRLGVQGPDLKFIPQYQIARNANTYQSIRLTKNLLSTEGNLINYYFELLFGTISHNVKVFMKLWQLKNISFN